MKVDSRFYMHDSDRAGLKALQAIPAFTPLLKSFMKVWNEKQFRIENMSSNLRVSEEQLPQYYEMLPPICEKMGIKVPELYIKLDVVPNAYTFGDTDPFIVVTSGLLETLPEELIPSVLAHECGHIACRHCLYTTMGSILLNGTGALLSNWGLTELVTVPLQIAFYYWMRCSEFSADRAAALYDGSAEKVVETCVRFAGFDKDICGQINVEAFMKQAHEYIEMVKDSAWNKTLEFIMFSHNTHPLNAVRAYECNEWVKTQRYTKLVNFSNIPPETTATSISQYMQEIPMAESAKFYYGKTYEEVQQLLLDMGFTNITLSKITEKGTLVKEGQVLNIRVNGSDGFNDGEWLSIDAPILIEYYGAETAEEIAAAHPGQLRTPNSSKYYLGRSFQEAVDEFTQAGFSEIILDEQIKAQKRWLSKNGSIAQISIGGQTQFEKGEWFGEKSVIKITYHTFSS